MLAREMTKVRFYCLALPSDAPQLGVDYLTAIAGTGLGVVALPIGPAFLMAGPWPRLLHHFTAAVPAGQYVNVVCAPLGLSLGFASSRAEMGASTPPMRKQGSKVIELPGDEDDIVYVPQTALSGLFTVGVPNVAIVQPPGAAQPRPSESELQALRQYDFVLSPTEAAVTAFALLDISAIHVPPDAGQLAKILGALVS